MGVTLVNPEYASERLYACAARILAANALCSFASVAEGGKAYIHTAFFCFSEALELFFLSHPDAVHSRNVRRSATTAVAVFDTHQIWGAPHQGLQFFGECASVSGADEERARELYALRFSLYREFSERLSAEEHARSSFRSLRFYGFTAARVKILDEREFGEEVFVTAALVR